jgi:hypothetical protein
VKCFIIKHSYFDATGFEWYDNDERLLKSEEISDKNAIAWKWKCWFSDELTQLWYPTALPCVILFV